MRRKDILKGLSFCITGKTFEKTQAEMAEVIKLYGGRVTNTVSSNTDYLIWGIQIAKNIKGKRSRNEELALMYEVPVMKFEELLEEIKDNKGKRLREAAKMRRNSKIQFIFYPINTKYDPIILNKDNPGRILGKAIHVGFDM